MTLVQIDSVFRILGDGLELRLTQNTDVMEVHVEVFENDIKDATWELYLNEDNISDLSEWLSSL